MAAMCSSMVAVAPLAAVRAAARVPTVTSAIVARMLTESD